MARWVVYGRTDDTVSCIVEASSKEEAMEKARDGELVEEWENASCFLQELVVLDAEEVEE